MDRRAVSFRGVDGEHAVRDFETMLHGGEAGPPCPPRSFCREERLERSLAASGSCQSRCPRPRGGRSGPRRGRASSTWVCRQSVAMLEDGRRRASRRAIRLNAFSSWSWSTRAAACPEIVARARPAPSPRWPEKRLEAHQLGEVERLVGRCLVAAARASTPGQCGLLGWHDLVGHRRRSLLSPVTRISREPTNGAAGC